MKLKTIFKFLSTFVIPLGIVLYLQFESIAPIIMLHNVIIGSIGGIDIYVRQLRNRQPIEQINLLGMGVGISSIVCFLAHMLLIAAIVYRPVDPLNIPIESHLLLPLIALIVFYLPWWPYTITRGELIIIYITAYIGLYIGSIILNKKVINF